MNEDVQKWGREYVNRSVQLIGISCMIIAYNLFLGQNSVGMIVFVILSALLYIVFPIFPLNTTKQTQSIKEEKN